MKQKNYTYKEVREVARQTGDNVALTFLAVLSDKYKFDEEKLTDLMRHCALVKNNPDVINRQDLRDIIEKHTGVDIRR